MDEAVTGGDTGSAAPGRSGLRIAAAAVLCLVAAGALLWWREGDAVFASLVTATLAWCF